MVIAPNIIYEEHIKLPQGSITKQLSEIPPVHISIDKDKNIQVNKENYQLNAFMDNFSLYAQDLDLKATVLNTYFKGSYWLIEGEFENQKVFFNHSEALEKSEIIFLSLPYL